MRAHPRRRYSRERYQDNSNVWKGGKWKCVDSHLLDEEIHFPDNRLCLDATREMGGNLDTMR